ncbi:asparagine synthase-related protein [Amycolatopsis aidingensis]|uniref:asparagine synthase-related protein n=1 Tax=Amycolatopsis aidingensis TaxID=2842453 RepID=UPI001C0B298F|nr:asparagine synthase-related protein [Amycolatopsis aidingensis]
MAVEAGWHFVTLPDHDEAKVVLRRLDASAYRVLNHPSGRPWLLTTTPRDQLVAHAEGPNRIAVLGWSSATVRRLAAAASGHELSALDDLAHELSGGFHLVASFEGRVRAQGSASGLRRVWHAEIDGVHIASDRADVLAELGGHPLDEVAVAIRLLRVLPHPAAEQPLWQGIRPVPPDSYLRLDRERGRTPSLVRWWRRPEPELTRAQGAERLRGALEDAVAARVRDGLTMHCDLSGGLDSTPLCYLAGRMTAPLLASTAYNDDPGAGEDLRWARRALSAMPSVRHEVLSLDDMPDFFGGIPELRARADEPTGAQLAMPRVGYRIEHARARGADTYLTGLGGDHLLRGVPVWEHTLFRRHPVLALRRVWANQMLEGRPMRTTVRALLANESYRSWFRRSVRTGEYAHMFTGTPTLDWDIPLSWPTWLRPEARDAVRSRLTAIAVDVEPLGPDRASHSELAKIRDGARLVRGLQQYAGTIGMPFEAPFFDDRVIEACLSVRRHERVHPKEYKPLVKAAMRGALPDDFLRRNGKTGGSAQAARGLRGHFDELVEFCARSPLAGLGLIDIDRLRREAVPSWSRPRDRNFDSTVNCAAFLHTTARRSAADTAA